MSGGIYQGRVLRTSRSLSFLDRRSMYFSGKRRNCHGIEHFVEKREDEEERARWRREEVAADEKQGGRRVEVKVSRKEVVELIADVKRN